MQAAGGLPASRTTHPTKLSACAKSPNTLPDWLHWASLLSADAFKNLEAG